MSRIRNREPSTSNIVGKQFRLKQFEYSNDLVLKNSYNADLGYGSKEFTHGDMPEYYNCIPYGYAVPGTKPGTFWVKFEYSSGTIDAYDERTDAVGIYYGTNLVWFAREAVVLHGY